MVIQHYTTRALSSASSSTWVRTNPKILPFNLHVQVKLSAGANLTYTVEYTSDNLVDESDTADAFDLPDFADLNSSLSKAVIAPINGVRLTITSYTSGTATLQVRQAGVENDA